MKLTFFGAAQNVTGSKHFVETTGFSFLFDCGQHQGRRQEAEFLNRHFPDELTKADAVVLSHAHLDHCGMLPVLVREGFKGRIYCTNATADIAEYILFDSAKLQEQDADFLNKHLRSDTPFTPLYTDEDVYAAFKHFTPVQYFNLTKKWTHIGKNAHLKLYDAGHILGSSASLVELEEKGKTRRILYTGDIGHAPAPLLKAPEEIEEEVEVLIMEATYGSRLHDEVSVAAEKLTQIVQEAHTKEGVILIPAFSLGRTQEIVYILNKLLIDKKIPHTPIYVDSPLAKNISAVFSKHVEDYNTQTEKDFGKASPFLSHDLTYIDSIEESKRLNSKKGPFIIITASGMMEGGRIRHHLINHMGNPNNYILITGFQAVNTLGRKIHHGESPVKIFDKWFDVNAKVVTLNEFSAHADQNGLLEYVKKIKGLKKVFLVHAELNEAQGLKDLLKKTLPQVEVHIPELKESFDL